MKKLFTQSVLSATLALLLSPAIALAQPLPKEFAKSQAQVTMVEFSAPWCLSCKKLKPDLEVLQKELGSKLVVHHLNIEKPETEKYINLYKIESAPTFILYNAQGKEVQRIERDITPVELRSLIKGLTNGPAPKAAKNGSPKR
jgi:thiol-disulfide isomerase/thioredoxin